MIAVERDTFSRAVRLWVDEDAEALLDLQDCECDCEACTVEPTVILSRQDADALVVELLRGPSGPPGPMGPQGASA